MPTETTSDSPVEYVFAKKGGAADWGWRDPAIALAQAWKIADHHRLHRAVAAIGCGLVAWIAKDIVGHGGFETWAGNALGLKWESLSHLHSQTRTLRNYMAVARACLDRTGLKPGTLKKSNFARWACDHFAGDLVRDPVYKAIVEYVGERSLWEIYQDEGIIRERDPHQVHKPANQTPEQAVQLEMQGILDSIETAQTNIRTLISTGNWEKIPKEKRWEFMGDSLAAQKAFVENTAWSPAERDAMQRNFVSLTAALRQGGK